MGLLLIITLNFELDLSVNLFGTEIFFIRRFYNLNFNFFSIRLFTFSISIFLLLNLKFS